jgi:hypothetical protein
MISLLTELKSMMKKKFESLKKPEAKLVAKGLVPEVKAAPAPGKIVQITVVPGDKLVDTVYALTDDGKVYRLDYNKWHEAPALNRENVTPELKPGESAPLPATTTPIPTSPTTV